MKVKWQTRKRQFFLNYGNNRGRRIPNQWHRSYLQQENFPLEKVHPYRQKKHTQYKTYNIKKKPPTALSQ